MSHHSQQSARFYGSGELDLATEAPGIQMWAVSLERAMLTYFEVAPGVNFEKHHHESEQITLVLQGMLYFEVDDRTYGVGPGGGDRGAG